MGSVLYVASWPRSGNTWVRMVLSYRFGLRSISQYDEPYKPGVGHVLGWAPLDAGAVERLYATQPFVPQKTHEMPSRLSPAPTIYVIRDGRDACVSWRRWRPKMLHEVIRGDRDFGAWSDHIRAWATSGFPLLAVRYEDMLGDMDGVVGRIGVFLGMTPVDAVMPSFDALRGLDKRFFASGRPGGWKRVFSPRERALFAGLHGETLLRYGYECPEHSLQAVPA